MTRIAVIEDDLPTSNQLAGWIRSAKSGIVIDQWFTRDEAEAALAREHYDAVVLDIELGRERHAGVALINAINKLRQGTPVLVVSAMPAAIYRSIMKALDAWDYLQKTTFDEAEFVAQTKVVPVLAQCRDMEQALSLAYEKIGRGNPWSTGASASLAARLAAAAATISDGLEIVLYWSPEMISCKAAMVASLPVTGGTGSTPAALKSSKCST